MKARSRYSYRIQHDARGAQPQVLLPLFSAALILEIGHQIVLALDLETHRVKKRRRNDSVEETALAPPRHTKEDRRRNPPRMACARSSARTRMLDVGCVCVTLVQTNMLSEADDVPGNCHAHTATTNEHAMEGAHAKQVSVSNSR